MIAETKDFSREALSELQEVGGIITMEDITPSSLHQILKNYDVFWFRLGFSDLERDYTCQSPL